MEQGSKEWIELRKNYIGASDAPAIMQVSPWTTPYQLWQEKLGLIGEREETEAMRYGKRMEEEARRKYESYTGILVSPEIVFHPNKKFMMASLDGISFNGDIGVEIKNANYEDHKLAKSGKIPVKYFPQLQHQLACLSFNMLHYFSYHNGQGVVVEVVRDDTYIEKLYLEERLFWDKVENLEAPEMVEKDYIQLDSQEWQQLANDWALIAQQLANLEKKEKEHRQALITMAGGANASGCGIKLTKIVRKGSIDYKAIPELKEIDIEKYRKNPVESWRIISGC